MTMCGASRPRGARPAGSRPTCWAWLTRLFPRMGSLFAFTSDAQGQPEIYVAPVAGGMARRLTWLGSTSRITSGNPKPLCWAPDHKVVFASDTGQPFSSLAMAYAVPEDGGQPPVLLPFGPVRDVSFGPGGGVVIGRNTGDPALWKRYRGGTAGSIWIDRDGTGEFDLLLRPEAIDGNLASPMWVGERIFFLSDHEGIGNLYSCSLAGDDIARHTDHDDHYARLASTDGNRIVYQVAGQIWLYEPATGTSPRSPRSGGAPEDAAPAPFRAGGPLFVGLSAGPRREPARPQHAGKTVHLGPFWRARRATRCLSGCALPAEQLSRRQG